MQSFIDSLNQEQLKAVLHKEGPAMVLAGAGSGKTRVLTTRAAWLIQEKNINPENILLVTFTNKAAGEMNKRVHNLTHYQLPFSGTFHSLCAKILRRDGHLIGLQPNFTIYDSSDQLALVKQLYKKHGFDKKKYKEQKIKGMISNAKNEMLSVNEYKGLANNEFQEFTSKVYKLYQKALTDQQAVDFDDLLLLVVKLLRSNKNVLNKYQEQFQHVLVDEYQDTNKTQYHLTKFFSRPQNNLYVVGDFSQSIYAWRGADYKNIFYLKDDFPEIKEYKLERNYRSTQTILDAANGVISKNSSHPILNLWTDKKSKDKIKFIEASTEEDEASQVIGLIRDRDLDTSYKDIAILYRTNAQSRPFEEAFVKSAIPYQIIGGFKFYDRKEIKDVLAYLKITVNPLDTVSLERATKIGKRRLSKLQIWLEEQKKSAEPTGSKTKFQTTSPLEMLKNILNLTDYLAKYNAENPEELSKIENIKELLNVASKFQDIANFLENISLVQDNHFHDVNAKEESNVITLMSLHAAKGLEFSTVFLVGLEEGLLPHSLSLFDKQQLEEERRLCYVGMTRAKKQLVCSCAKKRYNYGQSSYSTPSRFLADIPVELLDAKLNNSSNIKNSYYGKSDFNIKPKGTNKRRIVVDNDALDAILNDEMDIKEFLRS